ncbi:MAG: hypothetical protein AAF562_10945 [Pseudomonadota bacterium]
MRAVQALLQDELSDRPKDGRAALSLVPASTLSPRKARQRQLPALKASQGLTEVLVDGARDGAASAFAVAAALGALASRKGAAKDGAGAQASLICWVQDPMSRLEAGQPYPHGVFGAQLALVRAGSPADMLWAMEEALLSGAVGAVIGEVWGAPKALSFTATKRLQRAAQIGKTPAILLRYGSVQDGARPASGAHERWVLKSQPSVPHPDDPTAPGPPGWHLDRFKTRLAAPSHWTAHYEPETNTLLAPDDQKSPQPPDYEPTHPLPMAPSLAHGALLKAS